MKQNLMAAGTLLALLFLLAMAGGSDYDDELKQQQEYCKNVSSGIWPDYKGIASEVCK